MMMPTTTTTTTTTTTLSLLPMCVQTRIGRLVMTMTDAAYQKRTGTYPRSPFPLVCKAFSLAAAAARIIIEGRGQQKKPLLVLVVETAGIVGGWRTHYLDGLLVGNTPARVSPETHEVWVLAAATPTTDTLRIRADGERDDQSADNAPHTADVPGLFGLSLALPALVERGWARHIKVVRLWLDVPAEVAYGDRTAPSMDYADGFGAFLTAKYREDLCEASAQLVGLRAMVVTLTTCPAAPAQRWCCRLYNEGVLAPLGRMMIRALPMMAAAAANARDNRGRGALDAFVVSSSSIDAGAGALFKCLVYHAAGVHPDEYDDPDESGEGGALEVRGGLLHVCF